MVMKTRVFCMGLICLSLTLIVPVGYPQVSKPSPLISRHSAVIIPLTVFGDEFDLLYIDRYFYIDNQGLTRVFVELNGHKFKLAVDPQEVAQSVNAYLIPLEGDVTIDLHPYLNMDSNHMKLEGEGPIGAKANIIVADQMIGDKVDYVLDLVELPESFELLQNYPNPFNLSTNIVFNIPEHLIDGVNVQLAIYSLLGQKVRTLAEDRRFPGSFTLQWDGLSDKEEPVASGIYFYRIVAGKLHQTKRLTLIK